MADPNADIKHSPLETPPERGPASNMCTARAAQDGQRRSHTRQPEKIPPHVLMQAWNTRRPLRSVYLLPFHRSIRGSRAVIAQSDIRCCEVMRCQDKPVEVVKNACPHARPISPSIAAIMRQLARGKLASRAEQKAAIGALASKVRLHAAPDPVGFLPLTW